MIYVVKRVNPTIERTGVNYNMIGYDEKRTTYYVQVKTKDISGKWHTSKKRGFKLRREATEYERSLLNEKTKQLVMIQSLLPKPF